MLILTRQIGESVVIGDDIYCTILGYQGSEIKLAFDAPRSISIHRDEVQHQINRQREKNQRFNAKLAAKLASEESIADRLISKFKHEVQSTVNA